MKNITHRLVGNFVLIIVSMVIILELLFINTVKGNYYKNLEQNMLNQIKVSSDLYLKYFSDSSLYENVIDNVDTFWKQTSAQVQIIDMKGKVIMDSIGVSPKNVLQYSDVEKALHGETGTWVGNVNYDSNEVMAVSSPLKSKNSQVGVIRFITSLREVNNDIDRIIFIFVGIGVFTIFLGIAVSMLIAKTVTGPLKEVTNVAKIMAMGNFKVRSKKVYNDEIGKLSDTLNYMAEEITSKDQLKNDFISSVSHELRTPLTSIKGWAVTLREFNTDKDMLLDGLDIIETESDRLTGMVEELLDFSKFVAGKITLKNNNVNLKSFLDHIKLQYTPRATRENINFIVKYDDNIPTLFSDENRLKQIFINLLDNSFKFTDPNGTIRFSCNVEDNFVVFRVADNGCGISEEDLPKVKEKFYKGKNSKSKNGIGLSICDEIVSLMHGKFDIKSTLGLGTTISIYIPLTGEC